MGETVNLSLKDTINAADLVARAVWTACGAPTAFGWRDGLGKVRSDVLAQFVASRPEANAGDLYRFAVSDDPEAKDWREIPPSLRCAVEVFRGTFLALYREIQATAPAAGCAERSRGRHEESPAPPTKEPREIIYGDGRQGGKSERVLLDEGAGLIPAERLGVDRVVSFSKWEHPSFEVEVAALERQWADDDGRPKSKRGKR
jgi:hypothetical protein